MAARLVPLVTLVVSGFYLTQAMKLSLGTVGKPGAGFYPVAVGVFACVVALVASARAFLSPPGVRPEAPSEPIDPARRRSPRP